MDSLIGSRRTGSSSNRQKVGRSNSTLPAIVPIVRVAGLSRGRSSTPATGDSNMGKGNNSRKNDKKTMKPKQDKAKPAVKK